MPPRRSPGGHRPGAGLVRAQVHGSNGAPAAKLPVLHLVGAPSGTCRRLTSSPRPPWPRASGSWCEGDVCLEPLTNGVADQNDGVRLKIYVRPGASRTAVGGEYDGRLVVRVVEPADHGKATLAAINAVADALKIPRPAVTLVRGAASRRKLVEVDTGAPGARSIAELIASLRSQAN